MARLTAAFFERDPVVCARELIGACLEWGECAGRIVETEAYSSSGDEASHLFLRPSARRFVDEHPAGTAYVYMNYGLHWLFNVLVKCPQGSGFVLLRALEPLRGIELMQRRRGKAGLCELCSGPGKLTQALGIDGSLHGRQFLEWPEAGIDAGGDVAVDCGPRIGISRSQDLPWRFVLRRNAYLSR
ncbi:DNA-3-methyladenine glycosylase [Luteolibacter marinus]|uniref:DNA-3-methyladenine glycosylase n=1 Tax=Luteolibacter marinus TaxID=2776705 RepID=UPI0018677B2C|nr:DNA-3-methyladenine glycosylase [Luteolibacter marinus]